MPIDFEHLNQYTAGDKSLEAEVLRLFAETAAAAQAVLDTTSSAEEWRRAAHKLKGSALAIGAWQLADLAARAEMSGPAPPEGLQLLEAVRSEVAVVTAAIASAPGCLADR
ncbi:Hpt domain-containing protein [Rhodoligotrophos defluvii]|uniref:Hpt domain-containing protein n=1 Tax=Rhodoligotrophos defluvii TaxID=2561934 RepID=UPI001485296E|nr:Hpt domain-containing protein [Rhodoligotrophos defluvii]